MQRIATYPTLSVAFFPKETILRQALLVGGAVVFIALAAQVTWNYPFIETKAGEPVPITGQTFAVVVTGALLGARLGTTAVLAYLVAGIAGAPVFADWSRYYTTFAGATGGYLIGFLPAAFIVGWFAERGWDRSKWILLPMLLANAVIYVPGLIWLDRWFAIMGFQLDTFDAGLWPFIPGDLAKLVAAALVLPAGWSLVEQLRGGEDGG
ncbi:MAG: biotin transporter BioY [Chloroflexi bacterium]|nr:biotin transporter BioY [Chloroflexota bacterium]